MLTFDSPPVATARYLRAAFGSQALHITYAGSCPGANHDSIDARLRPSDLLNAFVESGIVLSAQPNCFDALVPLDRRRFYSLPGGVPTRDHVERVANRASIELGGNEVVLELTQHLIEETPALLDIALPLGCVCAGVGEHAHRGNPRAVLLTIEPPRARRPVLDQSLQVDVTQTLEELCEVRPVAPEEPAPLEVHLAADMAPVLADVEEIDVRRRRRGRRGRRGGAGLAATPARRSRARIDSSPRECERRDGTARVARGVAASTRAQRAARGAPPCDEGARPARASGGDVRGARARRRTHIVFARHRFRRRPSAPRSAAANAPPPSHHAGTVATPQRLSASRAPVITNWVATAARSSPMMRVITRMPVWPSTLTSRSPARSVSQQMIAVSHTDP